MVERTCPQCGITHNGDYGICSTLCESLASKQCTGCLEVKPLLEFNRWRQQRTNGRQTRCKACASAWYKTRELKPQGKRQQPNARYRPSKLKRFGLTPAGYDALFQTQGGQCAICAMTPTENGRELCVDHDHATGQVRGLLCHRCNTGLGLFRDDRRALATAIAYLDAS